MTDIWYIIHTATRVIYSQSRRQPDAPGNGLEVVGPIAYDIIPSIAGDPGWVLGPAPGFILRRATAQEWRQSGRDEAFEQSERQRRLQELKVATRNVRDDPTVPNTVKVWAGKLIQWLGDN